MVENLCFREIQLKIRSQQIAFGRCWQWLPHDCRPNHHAQSVERYRGTIPVWIHHELRLEHTIVVSGGHDHVGNASLADGDSVANSVASLEKEQVIGVVG